MYTSTQRERPAGISSGSIDALRVQLMKMNSQQLQAFATANQDDAIKLGLAAEADKYKKQHGQEAMALMSGQQAQPPVAQQILQSIGQPPQQPQPQQQQQPMPPQGQGMPPQGMPPQQMAQSQMPPQGMADGGYMLPEDQGIATLPSGNMDFAGGGIVAFGGGGDVPGYAGGAFTGTLGGVPSGAIVMGNMYQDPVTGKMIPIPEKDALAFGNVPINYAENKRLYEEKKQADLATRTAAAQSVLNESPEAYAARKVAELEAQGGKTLSPDARNMAMSQFVKEKIAGQVKRGEAGYTTESQLLPPATTYTGEKPLPKITPPGLTALPKPVVEPGLPAIAATKFQRTSVPDIDVKKQLELYDKAMPKDIIDPLAEQRREANAPAIQAAARQVSLFEQEVQNRKPAFEDRLKKLDEKEARVNTMGERNLNMSLLEAGLAMMSGDSPHAFVNIGKGAQVGVKAYAEGQAKVEAARDKMEEARSRIEEFRRSEDMMTAKDRRAVLRDYDNTVASAARDMFSGVEKMYGIKRDDIKTAIADKNARDAVRIQVQSSENMGIAGLESQRNIAMANMQNYRSIAAMPSATERILSNPALFNKQMELQTAAAGVRSDAVHRDIYAKSPLLQTQYPKIDDYLRAIGVQPTVNLPANAPVLP